MAWVLVAIIAVLVLVVIGIYNRLVGLRQNVRQGVADIDAQLRQRHDLIPNLVETVKGYAGHEQSTLTQVIEARAKATQVKVDANTITDPEKFKQYTQAQSELSGALSRLLVSVERYPDLKANQNFLALQSQLEGTENRISVARRDYIEAVRAFNTEMTTIPGAWVAKILYPSAKPMETFAAVDGAQTAPSVKF